jgi:hypothetical protein
MKKMMFALGLVSLLTLGVTNDASAQFGGYGGAYPGQTSARAKGAIIGGGLGAAAGAIISRRDPVAGGIIGAVLGAGAGYVIGNNEDKVKAQQRYGYPNKGYYNQQNSRYNRQNYHKNKGYRNRAYNYNNSYSRY